MLNSNQATAVIRHNLPLGKIQTFVEYKDLFLFQVFNSSPGEEDMDPFFSVDRNTGKFSEFSVMTDGDISEISALFLAAKHESEGS